MINDKLLIIQLWCKFNKKIIFLKQKNNFFQNRYKREIVLIGAGVSLFYFNTFKFPNLKLLRGHLVKTL